MAENALYSLHRESGPVTDGKLGTPFTAGKTDPTPDPPFLELMSGDPYEGEFFDKGCSRASLFSSSECPVLVRAL